MEKSSKQGYFLQWLIGMGDLMILNALFFGIYYALEPVYTQPIAHSLKEVLLLLEPAGSGGCRDVSDRRCGGCRRVQGEGAAGARAEIGRAHV